MIPSPINLHTVRSLSNKTHEECYNICLELGFSKKYLEGRTIFELWDMIIGVGGVDRERYDYWHKWYKQSRHHDKIRYTVGERK